MSETPVPSEEDPAVAQLAAIRMLLETIRTATVALVAMAVLGAALAVIALASR